MEEYQQNLFDDIPTMDVIMYGNPQRSLCIPKPHTAIGFSNALLSQSLVAITNDPHGLKYTCTQIHT